MSIIKKNESVAIDTVPLPERPVKGGIIIEGTKFILEVNERRIEIPIGEWSTKAEIQKLVGKEVAVYFSKTSPRDIVAIGTWPTPELEAFRFPRIICYIPAPDIIRRINPAVREAIIRGMVREKVISPRLATHLRGK